MIVSVAISGAMYGFQAAITGNWSWKQFGIELAIGAITGLIGGGIAGAAAKIAAKETVKQLAKTVVTRVGCEAAMTLRVVGMAVEESAENVGGQLIANVINKDPWDTGLAEAAISGALMGGFGSSATAQRLCFVAGTLVVTEDGTKPIEQMKKGDRVWSYNEKTGKSEINTVLDAFLSGYTDKIVEIKAGGELIEATEDHPFYIDNSWVKAKDLKEGTILTTKDGMKIKIDSVKVLKKGEKIPVYNITVDIVHTYYITNSKILVHNMITCQQLREKAKKYHEINFPNQRSRNSSTTALTLVRSQSGNHEQIWMSTNRPGAVPGTSARGKNPLKDKTQVLGKDFVIIKGGKPDEHLHAEMGPMRKAHNEPRWIIEQTAGSRNYCGDCHTMITDPSNNNPDINGIRTAPQTYGPNTGVTASSGWWTHPWDPTKNKNKQQ
jgi:hypothetical protein